MARIFAEFILIGFILALIALFTYMCLDRLYMWILTRGRRRISIVIFTYKCYKRYDRILFADGDAIVSKVLPLANGEYLIVYHHKLKNNVDKRTTELA